MHEQAARDVLANAIRPDDSLHNMDWYIDWSPGQDTARIDGIFSAHTLQAVAWWMQHKKGAP